MIAKVRVGEPSEELDQSFIVPIAVPELEDILKFASVLHDHGKRYDDVVWGWPVKYSPSSPTPPPDSNMTFTPADFFIGVWPIWYVSLMWENGDSAPPDVLIGDEDLIKEQ